MAADAKKPSIDFEKLGSKLKEHEKRIHIEDIMEKLTDKYSAHRKSIGGKRKLDTKQAEALGHQLYDELIDYVSGYYNLGKDAKKMKGAKGKHGESMLDSVVEHEFKLNRTALINNLKNAAEAGNIFSKKYITRVFDPHVNEYHKTKTMAIMKDIHQEHKGDLQKKISDYLSRNPGIEKEEFKGILKPTADFDDVRSAYAGLAGQYHSAAKAK
ncbi:MAG: hypothetical protein ACP5NW_00500 [Candidatus Woesearchaeota archaeon]